MPDDRATQEFNPYQAPASTDQIATTGPLGDWLARPSPSLSKVRSGIGIIFMANVLNVAAIACLVFGIAIPPLLLLVVLFYLLSWVLTIVGQVKCLSAPRESGGRGIIYASTVFMCLAMITSIANKFSVNSLWVVILSMLLSVVGVLLFVLFLLQLSRLIGKKSLIFKAKLALGSLILLLSVVVVLVALAFADPLPRPSIPRTVLVIFVALTFVSIYLSLLSDVSTLLRVRRVENEPTFVFPTSEE